MVDECTLLGIKRDSISWSGHSSTEDDKIASAQVAYSQTGAGLHGENRGNSGVLLSLWSAYVLPRLIYGLDVLKLSKSEIQKLNQFHKNFLNKSCIFRREQLTRRSICYLVNCRCRCNYTSEPLVRCVVCYAVAHLRENCRKTHFDKRS